MRQITFFLLCMLACFNAHCQTGSKFNYKHNQFDSLAYVVTLKTEKPLSSGAKGVEVRNLDSKSINNSYASIIEESISAEKLQKLSERRRVSISIVYSLSGKAQSIRVTMPKECMGILNEDELYVLYWNLRKYEIDMSMTQVVYPYHWVDGDTGCWSMLLPLTLKRQ